MAKQELQQVQDADLATVTFRIPRPLAKRLKLAAVMAEVSQQQVLTDALEAHLVKLEKAQK